MLLDPRCLPFTLTFEAHWQEVREEFLRLEERHFQAWFDRDSYSDGWEVGGLFSAERPEMQEWFDEVRGICPVTWSLLEELDGLHLASFSVLRPGAMIYPHEEPDFGTVRCHLPVVVPEGCQFKIGERLLAWEEGRCLVFDNRGLHAAQNTSSERRALLLVDVMRSDYGIPDDPSPLAI